MQEISGKTNNSRPRFYPKQGQTEISSPLHLASLYFLQSWWENWCFKKQTLLEKKKKRRKKKTRTWSMLPGPIKTSATPNAFGPSDQQFRIMISNDEHELIKFTVQNILSTSFSSFDPSLKLVTVATHFTVQHSSILQTMGTWVLVYSFIRSKPT